MWSQTTIQSFCRLVDGEPIGVNKYLPNSQAKALDELSGDEFCSNAQRGGTYSRALCWYRYQDFVRGVAQKENHPQSSPQQEIADTLHELYLTGVALPSSHLCSDTILKVIVVESPPRYGYHPA